MNAQRVKTVTLSTHTQSMDIDKVDVEKTVAIIIPARYRKGSVAFCEWLDTNFKGLDAGLVTQKAQVTFIGARERLDIEALDANSMNFSKWLTKKFDLDDFSTAVITRKAEETFRSKGAKPLASLADELLKPAQIKARTKGRVTKIRSRK